MMSASWVREDALPEGVNYRDTGCEVSMSCLACPLEACKYDVPRSRQLAGERRRRALELRDQGEPVEVIVRETGVSRRTVFRDLAS